MSNRRPFFSREGPLENHALFFAVPTGVMQGLAGNYRQSRNYLVEARIDMPKIEQERLAVIRYNYVSVEYVRGLGECQIIGYLLEAPALFNLLHSDALEQESRSCDLQTHGSHIPVAWDHFCLPNFKVAPLFKCPSRPSPNFTSCLR